MKIEATLGDLLYRVKGVVEHVGVYLGGNKVAHNSPDGNVQISSIEEYSKNQPVNVVKTDFDNIELLEQRLEEILSADKTYNLLGFNCEQFAHLLITGRSQSPQIRATIIGALTGFITGQAFNKKNSFWFALAGAAFGCILVNNNRRYDAIIDTTQSNHTLENILVN